MQIRLKYLDAAAVGRGGPFGSPDGAQDGCAFAGLDRLLRVRNIEAAFSSVTTYTRWHFREPVSS